jgi:hypothetical protein
MGRRTTAVALLGLTIGSGAGADVDRPPAEPPTTDRTPAAESTIAISPSPPPPLDLRLRLRAWNERCEDRLEPVIARWSELLDALGHFHLWRLEERCERFAEAVEQLLGAGLAPAPEAMVDLHFRSLLDRLQEAAAVCSRRRYFETGHRLDLAAHAWGRMRRAVERSTRDGT